MGRETSPVWWLEGVYTCDPNMWKAKKGDFLDPRNLHQPWPKKEPRSQWRLTVIGWPEEKWATACVEKHCPIG